MCGNVVAGMAHTASAFRDGPIESGYRRPTTGTIDYFRQQRVTAPETAVALHAAHCLEQVEVDAAVYRRHAILRSTSANRVIPSCPCTFANDFPRLPALMTLSTFAPSSSASRAYVMGPRF